jgi:hypothetical protein
MLTQQAPTTSNVIATVSNKVEAVKASLATAKPSVAAAAKHAAAAKPVVAAKAGKESAKQFPHYDYYAPSVVVSGRTLQLAVYLSTPLPGPGACSHTTLTNHALPHVTALGCACSTHTISCRLLTSHYFLTALLHAADTLVT